MSFFCQLTPVFTAVLSKSTDKQLKVIVSLKTDCLDSFILKKSYNSEDISDLKTSQMDDDTLTEQLYMILPQHSESGAISADLLCSYHTSWRFFGFFLWLLDFCFIDADWHCFKTQKLDQQQHPDCQRGPDPTHLQKKQGVMVR